MKVVNLSLESEWQILNGKYQLTAVFLAGNSQKFNKKWKISMRFKSVYAYLLKIIYIKSKCKSHLYFIFTIIGIENISGRKLTFPIPPLPTF